MNRQRAWFVVKVVVSVSLLALLFSRLGTDAVRQVVRDASPWLPVAAVVMLTLQTALSAGKWLLLLRTQGIRIGFGSLLKTYLIANFINLFMPSVVGGDAVRAARVSKHTGGFVRALPSIVLDRATGIVALLVVGVFGVTVLLAPDRLMIVSIGLVLVLLAGYGVVVGPLRSICQRVPAGAYWGIPHLVGTAAQVISTSTTLLWVVGLSLAFQFNTVLINAVYSLLIGIDVPFTALLLIVPIVYFAETVPISINGLGVREATYAFMFAELGLPPAQGMLLGLTVSVMRYVAGVVGGTLLAVDTFQRPSEPGGKSSLPGD